MHVSDDNTLKGYMNHSLAVFRVSDYPADNRPFVDNATNIEYCRWVAGGAEEWRWGEECGRGEG